MSAFNADLAFGPTNTTLGTCIHLKGRQVMASQVIVLVSRFEVSRQVVPCILKLATVQMRIPSLPCAKILYHTNTF
jgi:hypothetical protein